MRSNINNESKNLDRKEALLDAFGQIEDKHFIKHDGSFIEAAQVQGKTKLITLKRISLIAAALVLVFGLAYLIKLIPFGGNSSVGGGSREAKILEDGSTEFMSYKGPVLPLLLRGEEAILEELQSKRKLTYDFYLNQEINKEANVSSVKIVDKYTITNTADSKTVKLSYPFVSNVRDLFFTYPKLTLNGKEIDTRLTYGKFTGQFTSGSIEEIDQSLNYMNARNWTDYNQLLSSDTYYAQAKDKQFLDLNTLPVTVYAFKNTYYPENLEGIETPTLIMGIEIDRAKSKVLNYGFNGFANPEGEKEYYAYSMPRRDYFDWGKDEHYLIILGDDAKSYSIEMQKTGGWDTYEEDNHSGRNNLKEAKADFERIEMTLGEALDLALKPIYANYQNNMNSSIKEYQDWQVPSWKASDQAIISYEDFKELYLRDLKDYGQLSDEVKTRYEEGMLELFDVTNMQRVFYLEFEIDLGAEETNALSIEAYKPSSQDFYGNNQKQQIVCYDLLQNIASVFPLEETAAAIKDYEKVTIVRQNFGFDLAKGIREVKLSDSIAHYYMEVTTKK